MFLFLKKKKHGEPSLVCGLEVRTEGGWREQKRRRKEERGGERAREREREMVKEREREGWVELRLA